MLRLLFVALLAMLCGPATAAAAVECGDPAGPAHHVIAVGVPCSNALAFASTVAERGVTRSRTVGLPGWRAYRARVRRVAAGYDVRAARGRKVIRFQYTVEVAPVDGRHRSEAHRPPTATRTTRARASTRPHPITTARVAPATGPTTRARCASSATITSGSTPTVTASAANRPD